jgi:hypothetical protein
MPKCDAESLQILGGLQKPSDLVANAIVEELFVWRRVAVHPICPPQAHRRRFPQPDLCLHLDGRRRMLAIIDSALSVMQHQSLDLAGMEDLISYLGECWPAQCMV